MVVRTIAGTVAFTAARAGLARMACDTGNPADGEHDHVECIRDDIALAADLQLRLLAAISGGDDDLILQRLSELTDAIDPER